MSKRDPCREMDVSKTSSKKIMSKTNTRMFCMNMDLPSNLMVVASILCGCSTIPLQCSNKVNFTMDPFK